MSRLYDVIYAFQQNIVSAVNTYSGLTAPAQCLFGYPNVEDLTKILQQSQYLCSVVDQKVGSDRTRFYPQWMKVSDPNIQLTSSLSANVLTFAGTIPASYNVHVLVGAPEQDALVQVTPADTLATTATRVAAAVTALGITATASGSAVTIASPTIICNIGGTAQMAREVARKSRMMKVTVWAPTPQIRDTVGDTIETYVGAKGTTTKFIPIADGTNLWAQCLGSVDQDDKQADYSMYERHIMYEIEYGMLQYQSATQIGSTSTTYSINGTTLSPIIEGQ